MTLEEKIIALTTESLGLSGQDDETVTLQSNFTDLGADSLDKVELAMTVEDKFEITVSNDEMWKIQTVGGIVELVRARAAARKIEEVLS